MSKDKHPTSVAEQDYDDIQAAVMETERGRWFLSEFAQRNRVADTKMLLEAIGKLETMVAEKEEPVGISSDVEKMRFDIVDMANAIALTKQQIAGISSSDGEDSRLDNATAELDAIVVAAETATSDILSAAEHIQEVAWSMREDGASETDFEKLDEFATDIYTACSFQDITGQRTSKVIDVLHFLESRILEMMKIWGIEGADIQPFAQEKSQGPDSHLLNGPALDGDGIDQDDIDLMLADEDELFEAVAQPIDEMVGNDDPVEDEVHETVVDEDVTEPVLQEMDDPELSEPIDEMVESEDLVEEEVLETTVTEDPTETALQEMEEAIDPELRELIDDEVLISALDEETAVIQNIPVEEDNVEFLATTSDITELDQTDKIALFT